MYKGLTVVGQRMWNVKANMCSMNNRDNWISESFRTYLSNITEKYQSKELIKQPYWALHTCLGKY